MCYIFSINLGRLEIFFFQGAQSQFKRRDLYMKVAPFLVLTRNLCSDRKRVFVSNILVFSKKKWTL